MHWTLIHPDFAILLGRLGARNKKGRGQENPGNHRAGFPDRLEHGACRAKAANNLCHQSTLNDAFFNLSALVITETLLMAIAALAKIGLSSRPKNG
jgi:hypothetical protein